MSLTTTVADASGDKRFERGEKRVYVFIQDLKLLKACSLLILLSRTYSPDFLSLLLLSS